MLISLRTFMGFLTMTIFPLGRATWPELALASVALVSVACGTTVAVVCEDIVACGCVAAVTVVAACGAFDN